MEHEFHKKLTCAKMPQDTRSSVTESEKFCVKLVCIFLLGNSESLVLTCTVNLQGEPSMYTHCFPNIFASEWFYFAERL